MFFFRKLTGAFFLGLLVLGLFGLFGRNANSGYDAAYRQGFLDGQQAAVAGSETAAETTTVPPSSSTGTNIYYRDRDFFFPGSAALLCLVPLVAFSMLFMGMGKRRHGRHGPWGPCGPRGPRKHGPWQQEADSPSEKSPDDIDDGPDETIYHA